MHTVLVVEDEQAVRLVVTRLLQQKGFEVLEAANGAEALAAAQAHPDPISLLVTDIGLGDMDGLEVASRVRERHPEAKVIYVSGQPGDPRLAEGQLGAGEAFLAKPFKLAELLDLVRRLTA